MKKEDLFKNITDIDDDLIANAKPNVEEVEPTVIHVAGGKRKLGAKAVLTAAACLALIGVAGAAAGINYYNSNIKNYLPTQSGDSTNMPSHTGNDVDTAITAKYPDIPLYRYTGDYSEFDSVEAVTCEDLVNDYQSYSAISQASDLVVVGEFIDDPCQNIDPTDKQVYDKPFFSYNIFKIDKVLKGDAKEGDQIVIEQQSAVLANEYKTCSALTPMLKGDRWVYFLHKDDDTYFAVNDYQGRYPVPGEFEGNAVLSVMPSKYGTTWTDDKHFCTAIYNTLSQMLVPESTPKLKMIVDYGSGLSSDNAPFDDVTFEMAEFPGVVFNYIMGERSDKHGLYVNDRPYMSESRLGNHIWGGTGVFITKLYLLDLNNDGKRELCAEIHTGSGIDHTWVYVWDYANQKVYAPGAESDGIIDDIDSAPDDLAEQPNHEFWLVERDGELYLLETEFTMDNLGNIISYKKLSLDLMHVYSNENPQPIPESIEIITDIEMGKYDAAIFTMPEFPEFKFTFRDRNDPDQPLGLEISNEATGEIERLCGGEQGITKIYLTDLNNDGYRELCVEIRNGQGINQRSFIYVWDKHSGQEYELNYTDEYDYYVTFSDEVLMTIKMQRSGDLDYEKAQLDLNDMEKVKVLTAQ